MATSRVKKWMHRLSKAIMKSHHVRISKHSDLPVKFRPWFVFFTCLIIAFLGFLGFTNFPTPLPLNGTVLHFLCFGVATGVFYWIIDVEENARRLWFWRNSGVIFTLFICFFCGGIASELVQALLPYKALHFMNIVANLAGSSTGLTISYFLEKYYRRRREITRLYRPMNPEYSEDEDDEISSAFLLPTHSPHLLPVKSGNGKTVRFAESDRETRGEVFNVGDDDESDEETSAPRPGGSKIHVTEPPGKGDEQV